ncbi:phosphotransferase [Schleiferilactobacillus shenzhenensis]|uniref:Aminoglycoside phosphotransferase domain-containing protein n=1 Tax=Schleiferilactobacillus shenzhenensis LY-73 TaxID=1231336 RepID=U4TQ93_9LACO|nr:phosphotransferase [Schleiferilactobacillus shenzhenensis]ERL63697.1 hypothetical protein L248_2287 [Schleiferilactobacillus shenzhenensis LY-73]
MTEEIPLTGGRVTTGVVRVGQTVHRPVGPRSPFVHRVLNVLGGHNAPQYLGDDQIGREVLTYIPGAVPADLGFFSLGQCVQAARLIRQVRDRLSEFPDCGPGQTVCHNDLSPCNFVFQRGQPVAIIDWDAAAVGDPLDDLAYALWLWLDLGNPDNDLVSCRTRLQAMLTAYGVPRTQWPSFSQWIPQQMARVAVSAIETPGRTRAVRAWVARCSAWWQSHGADLLR